MTDEQETILEIKESELDRLLIIESRYRKLLRRFHLDERLLFQSSFNGSALPEGAESFLRRDNQRLRQLEEKYRAMSHPVIDPSQWADQFVAREVNLRFFRGDFAYMWQSRDINLDLHHALTAYYVKSIDKLGLLNELEEDGLFGAYTLRLDERSIVSRDLLDSIVEIYFLEQNLPIFNRDRLNVLDIGAGYGRLAHRLVEALPNIGKVLCADAVAVSTFISEYYLGFRNVADRAVVVPLDELDDAMAAEHIDIAVNIHSFSECTLSSVVAWLDILARHKVSYLMVVPNANDNGGTRLLTYEKNGKRIDFSPAFNQKGYRLVACQPKYSEAIVQKYGVSPTYHYLFERVP
jgi:SAM-dependent methyltransferase